MTTTTTENTTTTESAPLEWAALWAAMTENPEAWIPTTEAMYSDMLEVLPPAGWVGGAFLVGEPNHHNAQGEAVYACFRKIGDKFHARYLSRREFRETFATRH